MKSKSNVTWNLWKLCLLVLVLFAMSSCDLIGGMFRDTVNVNVENMSSHNLEDFVIKSGNVESINSTEGNYIDEEALSVSFEAADDFDFELDVPGNSGFQEALYIQFTYNGDTYSNLFTYLFYSDSGVNDVVAIRVLDAYSTTDDTFRFDFDPYEHGF